MATLNIKNLPDRLHRKLQARAKRNHRSVTQEVTHILEQVVASVPEHSILDLQGLGKEHWSDIDPVRLVAEERKSWDSHGR